MTATFSRASLTRTLARNVSHRNFTFTTARHVRSPPGSICLNPRTVGLGLGLTTSLSLVAIHQQQPIKFDSQTRLFSTTTPREEPKKREGGNELLNPDTVKQLSGGSLAGFAAGLLVSVFSKTLVLLAGIGMVVIQVAARNGMNLISMFKLKERANTSRILALLNRHTAFKLAFAVAFSLSAFMSF
ncbi:uncharacterized protein C8A04DRAFT_28447 [Dichotomopilus funicola]|uniref:Uncharacterized protein n=1 Tax=Dichotomopilus funicola TaxID=1934379 RepID=A0AAN6V3R0_9PEZI|nr:hypothetical protein C8A04DRAFT_28447 [Dichotomopilus funicola]